jgi:hypothetical protein
MKPYFCTVLILAFCCFYTTESRGFAANQTKSKATRRNSATSPAHTKKSGKGKATKTEAAKPFAPSPAVAEAITKLKADFANEIAIRERNIQSLNAELQKKQELFKQGIVAKKEVQELEGKLAVVRAELTARQKIVEGEIAAANNVAAEAAAAEQLAKTPLRGNTYVATNALIRYNGSMAWNITNITKVSAWFVSTYNHALPISAFGQTNVHNQLGFDHSNSVDVALHPDSPEGLALVNYLRSAGIPFLAFRQAVPGSATGAHIHIGYPSHRFTR